MNERAKQWLLAGSPLVIFLAVTLFLTYPVSLHLNSLVLGRPYDDVFESIWFLHWYKHALFDLGVSPLYQPNIFYPGGWNLGFAVMPPLFPALLAPLTALVGPIAAYNLALIGSTVLGGYGVFRLHQAMGGRFWGGILAGLLFAFYPNRQVHMHGFLNFLLGSMWLPWLLYCLFQATNQPARRGRWLALAAVAFSLTIGGAWQFAFISTAAVVLFGLVYIVPVLWREGRLWLRPLLLAALVVLVTAGPLLFIGLRARDQIGESVVFPLEDLAHTSVSLERLLVPSAWNPLVWTLARETFPLHNGEDSIVTFGFLSPILASVWLGRARPWTRQTWALFALFAGSLVLMAGPFVQVDGQPVVWPASALGINERWLPALMTADGGMRLPLPVLALYTWLPPFRSFHHFGRFGLVAVLGVGVLAGLGLSRLTQHHHPPVRAVLGIVCCLIVLLEFNTQPQPQVTSAATMQRDVDAWLAAQTERAVIIEYPLWYTAKAQSLYYTTRHQQKTVHGYSIIWPPGFLAMRPTLDLWPEAPALDLLAQTGVRYILVHVFRQQHDFETDILPGLLANKRLRLVGRFDGQPAEEAEHYFFGRITTLLDPVGQTYLFELQSP